MVTPITDVRGNSRPDLETYFEFSQTKQLAGCIGYRILPLWDTETQSAQFGKVEKEHMAKLADVKRNSQGGYNRISMQFGDDNFSTTEYGLEAPVDQRNARLYKNYVNAEIAAMMHTWWHVRMQAELRVAAMIFNEATFGNTAVGTEWDQFDTAVPIDDVFASSQRVRNKTGQYANAAVMSRKVRRNVIRCKQIIDRVAAQGSGDKVKPDDITDAQLAACFDLKHIIVGDCSYDPTDEGQSTTDLTDVWDDEYVWVGTVAETEQLEEVAVGRTFHYVGDDSEREGHIETYGEDQVRGDVVRCRHEVHEKVIHADCGDLIKNITQ